MVYLWSVQVWAGQSGCRQMPCMQLQMTFHLPYPISLTYVLQSLNTVKMVSLIFELIGWINRDLRRSA